jgi:glycosyltransferase involved in cell wall biosynthesis
MLLAQQLAHQGLHVAIIAFGDPGELPSRVEGVDIVRRPAFRKKGRLVGKVIELALIWRALWKAPSETVVYRGAGLDLGLLALYVRCSRRRLVFSSANIVDFHPDQILTKRRDRFLYRLGVRWADQIVVQTDEQVQMCQEAFGTEPMVIRSIAQLGEPQTQEPEAFLWVGRLVSYKRPLDYIALARAVPEARFWMIVVPAPLASEQATAAAVRSAAIDVPNLELLEPRPRTGIEALMDRAVASVNTAEFEGMPNVLLEAWSRGVPALVLRHDPDRVVTRQRLGGFADGSLTTLAALAREQWRVRCDRAELAARCRAYIATHHAAEVVAQQWRAAISRTAAATPPQPSPVDARCAA